MKRVIVGLLAAASLGACTGYAYIADLPRSHRAAIVESDSSCDHASADDRRDPASHCYVDRRETRD
jgi:hypothetical protein